MQHTMKIFVCHELHLVLLAVYPAWAAAAMWACTLTVTTPIYCMWLYGGFIRLCPWFYTLVTFGFFFVLKAPVTINLCGELTVLQSEVRMSNLLWLPPMSWFESSVLKGISCHISLFCTWNWTKSCRPLHYRLKNDYHLVLYSIFIFN